MSSSDGTYPWTSPTLENGWVNLGDPNVDVSYRLNSRTGLVELRGGMTDGTCSATAFTLPAGFRSFKRLGFAVVGGSLNVNPDGTVVVFPAGSTILLDGIQFEAAQ